MCIYTTTSYTNLSLCAYKAAKCKNSLSPFLPFKKISSVPQELDIIYKYIYLYII